MTELIIKSALPAKSVAHFVHSFWMLENKTGKAIPSTVLPNGMVDMTLIKTNEGNWEMFLRGINTEQCHVIIEQETKIFTIGLKLLAVEYVLGDSIKDVLNEGKTFSNVAWYFTDNDLSSFQNFIERSTQIINAVSTENIDSRKQKLFELIYASNGAMPVKQLSQEVFWSSRQINRYFNQQFGIALKTYCSMLRLGSSFKHISEGKLFPEQAFTDQNHFIKEIKKYSGVTPKELSKNKDDRFIDITAIKKLPS